MDTIKTPSNALSNLIFEYAQARVATMKAYRIHPRLPAADYWQGRLDGIAWALATVYGLNSEAVESRKDYQQYVIDVDKDSSGIG